MSHVAHNYFCIFHLSHFRTFPIYVAASFHLFYFLSNILVFSLLICLSPLFNCESPFFICVSPLIICLSHLFLSTFHLCLHFSILCVMCPFLICLCPFPNCPYYFYVQTYFHNNTLHLSHWRVFVCVNSCWYTILVAGKYTHAPTILCMIIIIIIIVQLCTTMIWSPCDCYLRPVLCLTICTESAVPWLIMFWAMFDYLHWVCSTMAYHVLG